VFTVAGDVAVVAEMMVEVLPLQVCALSFQVPLHALMATVPVVTPATMMLYVDPSRCSVPVLVTVRYCGVDGVNEIGNVINVLEGAAFQAPDVTVCVADARPVSPA
jgi:hypothetical protein